MLKYTLSFDRPWAFAFILLFALVVLLPYFLTPKNKRRSLGRIISLVARCIGSVICVFLLAGTTVTETVPLPETTSMVIVVDYSDSVEDITPQIESYIGTMLKEKDANTSVRFVKFSGTSYAATSEFTADGDTAYEEFLKATGEMEPMDSTDINGALRFAASLFEPDDHNKKRIVLLSDGRETTGNAWEAAAEFTNPVNPIRLDTVSFDVTDGERFSEVALLSVGVMPGNVVNEGTNMRLSVKIRSSVATEGVLYFYDGDTSNKDNIIEITEMPLEAGDNIVSLTYKTDGKVGLHNLSISFKPKKDTIDENNTLGTWVKVNGKANILLVGSQEQTDTLKPQIETLYETDTCVPSEFPKTMRELLKYDEVVLMNVEWKEGASNSLPAGADAMLERFVSKIGRGLYTTSGPTQSTYFSYGDSDYLANMLPVNMTLDETDFNVAVVLVIDDSSSMIQGAFSATEKFAHAQAGAKKVIDALGENDYIGIVTFHAEATVQYELDKPDDKEELKAFVDTLNARDKSGTDYSKGLIAAHDMLKNFPYARSKHIIFVSDGYPTQGNHEQLPGYMKNSGISLSTIGLMTDAGAKKTLADMANAGGGVAKTIDAEADLDNLAGIMEEIVKDAQEPQFVNNEPFKPLVGDDTGVLNGVEAANMTLGGYIGSTLKETAKMPLHTNDFRPVIAEWDYGRGHVTTLMMDLTSSAWCGDFFKSENNGFGLLRNLVGQSINEEIKVSGLSLSTRQIDKKAHLTVNSSCVEPGQILYVYVNPDAPVFDAAVGGEEVEKLVAVEMSASGSSEYRGSFDTPNPNHLYYIRATLKDVNGDTIDETTVAYNGGILAEYDLYSVDGKAVMEGIATKGGGQIMETGEELFSVVMEGQMEFSTKALLQSTIALIVLLAVDFLCRNLRLKHKAKKKN